MAGWWMVATAALLAASTGAENVGAKIENFSLQDFRGKPAALADAAGKKAVVVAFLGTECPLAKLYAPKLQALSEKFGPQGVAFLAIDSNRQDSMTELAAFARSHGLTFPLLKDPGNVVADRFGARRTPEVFVLDAERKIRYRGRIDDQYGLGKSSGYAKYKANREDLSLAIEDLLAGRAVQTPATEAVGCIIGRVPKVQPHGDVTYSRQIARILQERCVSCHRPGEVAPFSLTSYDEVVGWGETIREVVDEGRMPPWFADPKHGKFANDARLSDDEKKLVRQWIANGSPKGDEKDLPPAKVYADGWQIPQPDLVVKMASKPFTVPAEGVVRYQHLLVDPGFKEDKWIKAAEARPGNRAVVHHIIVFIVPPGGFAGLRRGGDPGERLGGGLAAYAPGNSPTVLPEGTAIFAPAGSKLVFQMHYTPNGVKQDDLSYVGVAFADPKTVKKKLLAGAVSNRGLSIPPGAEDHRVDASRKISRDMLLLTMAPHMHLRGKAFRFEAEYPNGKREILLDVPRYDFNWQLTYQLAEPKRLPAGTVIHCVARYDNSSENLANPNPNETVKWGPQTWHEMMIGFFRAVPVEENVSLDDDDKPSASIRPAGESPETAKR